MPESPRVQVQKVLEYVSVAPAPWKGISRSILFAMMVTSASAIVGGLAGVLLFPSVFEADALLLFSGSKNSTFENSQSVGTKCNEMIRDGRFAGEVSKTSGMNVPDIRHHIFVEQFRNSNLTHITYRGPANPRACPAVAAVARNYTSSVSNTPDSVSVLSVPSAAIMVERPLVRRAIAASIGACIGIMASSIRIVSVSGRQSVRINL